MMSMTVAERLAPRPEAAAETSLAARLRRETRDLHDRIKANHRFARLMAPDLTRGEYRGLVARLHGHHAPLEEALLPLLPAAFQPERRLPRRALLRADLRALGLAEAAIDALPQCQAYRFRTPAQALGALYVLEGAGLGGQVIARHLAATLRLGPEEGTAALVPHGAETGALWRQFRLALDGAAVEAAGVVEAARFTFTTLDRWMAEG